MAERVTVTARSGEATCGYCRSTLAGAGVACGGCGVALHAGCRLELGRCPTLGCREAGRAPTTARRPARIRSRLRAVGRVVLIVVVPLGLAAGLWLGDAWDRERAREADERWRRANERRQAGLEADRAEAERARWAAQLEAEARRLTEERAARREAEAREAARKAAAEAAARQAAREAEATRRAAVDAEPARVAALPTPVEAVHAPLSAPDRSMRLGDASVGTAAADRVCGANELRLELEDLRRLLLGAFIRGLALVEEFRLGDLHDGDRAVYRVTVSRTQGYATRRTRWHAAVVVRRPAPDRLELVVQAQGRRVLEWREVVPLALVGEVARVQWPVRDDWSGLPEVQTREADAEGTAVRAVWPRGEALQRNPPLPDQVQLGRARDGVRHEVELRRTDAR